MVNSPIAPAGLFSSSRSNRSLSSAQSLLSGLSQSQNSTAAPGFRDLLSYFLQLESMARQLARQQAAQAELSGVKLLTAPLHLDIRIESFSKLSAADAGGTLPFEEQDYSSDEGLATRIALRTPEIQADGSVSYNVMVLKLAVSIHALEPRPDVAQAISLGQPQIGAAGATVGQSLADFMGQSGFAGSAGTLLWEYSADNDWAAGNLAAQQKMVDDLYAMANALMDYLNQQQILHAFDMSAEEKKRLEEMLRQQEIAAEKAAVIQDIQKKKLLMELVLKDTLKRLKNQHDLEQQSSATSLQHRLMHFLGSTEKQLEQPDLDPAQYAGLLEDFHRLSLDLKAAAAAQTSVPTNSAH